MSHLGRPWSHRLRRAACTTLPTQDVSVQVLAPLSGPGRGQIGVRVGRRLVYVANREAVDCFVDAWLQAEALADGAFGPALPPYARGKGTS